MPFHFEAKFDDLGALLAAARRASAVLLFRATDRAAALVRIEAPGGPSGRIGKAVTKAFDHSTRPPEGLVLIDATVRRSAGVATLHLPDGGTKQVATRGSSAANLAELFAEGTGLRGPRRTYIEPNRSKVLLVAVDDVPASEAYLEQGGQRFIFRPRSRGIKRDDYPGRAEKTFDFELDGLTDRALAEARVL